MDPQQVPVLLVAFRRPELTARVLARLREVAPRRLYVATDAAAADRPADAALVEQTRAVIRAEVDWPCRLERLDRREHRGCRRGVAEDDVLPEPSFFPFCAALLEHYRHDGRIGAISANNFQPSAPRDGASYYFSHYNHVWGWASWRRAWAAYDAELESWPRFRDQGWLEDVGGRRFARYWTRQIERVHRGELDTWDYIWTYSCWRAGLLTCLPAVRQLDRWLRRMVPCHQAFLFHADFARSHPYETRLGVTADRPVMRAAIRAAGPDAYLRQPVCRFRLGGVSSRQGILKALLRPWPDLTIRLMRLRARWMGRLCGGRLPGSRV